jgi:hypothetical protein
MSLSAWCYLMSGVIRGTQRGVLYLGYVAAGQIVVADVPVKPAILLAKLSEPSMLQVIYAPVKQRT